MMIALFVVLVFVSALLAVSIVYLVRFGKMIINSAEAVEDSLEVIEDGYIRLDKILKTPLFLNNAEVRSALETVRNVRESLLYIADRLVTRDEEKEDGIE